MSFDKPDEFIDGLIFSDVLRLITEKEFEELQDEFADELLEIA